MSSFECMLVGGTGGVLRGDCEVKLVENSPNARSGVMFMFPRVLSGVNGLNESIVYETSSISDMLFCLLGQLVIGRVCAHYLFRYLRAIEPLLFRVHLLDLSA